MTISAFSRIPIEHLLKWMLNDWENGHLFGIQKELGIIPSPFLETSRFGQRLESPLGVAAGPHTQMAQNLISAWLMGSRFLELKTVQTLDQLDIAKPCIDMEDEGYNCEWSQELSITDSADEYINAWILIHILKQLMGQKTADAGFIFNMSVGYNLEGILQNNVQDFLKSLDDATDLIQPKLEILRKKFPGIQIPDIPNQVSNNVTLSTMHGCPPHEIEKIARYFLVEKGLHTTIKLNPTLLGPDRVREILNHTHHFKVEVPDEAFEHDLSFDDGVAMIQRLQETAKTQGLHFGLKLTNTLEVVNPDRHLPGEMDRVYMSGRALHPISVHVALKLQEFFKGELDISFAGGADCFNVTDLVRSGLAPVTVCSDLLKPGGYVRLRQYFDELAKNLPGGLQPAITPEDALKHLRTYADKTLAQSAYTKTPLSWFNIKTDRPLSDFDCIAAPCVSTCPATQEIPAYMRAVADGDFDSANDIILRTNPFPNVTGKVCDHTCQSKCTRQNMDVPLQIRAIKQAANRFHLNEKTPVTGPSNKYSVAIIGAGPSGLSAGYCLRLNGFSVDIFEATDKPGGMVSQAIPAFRLSNESIDLDLDRIRDAGVNIHYQTKIDANQFQELRTKNDFVFIAVGAQKPRKLGIPGETLAGVYDQLQFLKAIRSNQMVNLGEKVAIIGGGNSAIDTARTALRMVPDNGSVTVLYRRTRNEMPAEIEEIEALLTEGIQIHELSSPLEIHGRDGKVSRITCQKMKLGDPDTSGRRRPVPLQGETFDLDIDSVISAVGQEIEVPFLDNLKSHSGNLETSLEGVFLGGDASHGPGTIIQAVSDGLKAAHMIMKKANQQPVWPLRLAQQDPSAIEEHQKRVAHRVYPDSMEEPLFDKQNPFANARSELSREEAITEAKRCLSCDQICDMCVSVCPNRANQSYDVMPFEMKIPKVKPDGSGGFSIGDFETFKVDQSHQVLNIGDFCNECGNCAVFCPTAGAPYRDKPKFYLNRTRFESEQDGLHFSGTKLLRRQNGQEDQVETSQNSYIYRNDKMAVEFDLTSLQPQALYPRQPIDDPVSLMDAIHLIFLHKNLENESLARLSIS